MRYKALKPFAGIVSACAGDVFEIKDTSLAADLMNAGYVICLEDEQAEKPVKKTATVKKTAAKGAKKNG